MCRKLKETCEKYIKIVCLEERNETLDETGSVSERRHHP